MADAGKVARTLEIGAYCKPENLERIIREHLLAGQPVEDLVFARNPLPAATRPEELPSHDGEGESDS